MGIRYTQDSRVRLPEVFCWTKFGTEAGEDVSSILRRKEAERRATAGIFLWGIGNAIGPSIEQLIIKTPDPKVVFTPMLSRPSTRDVAPPATALWFRGTGLNGEDYEVPRHARVTSRMSEHGRPHYALVCRSRAPIMTESPEDPAVFSASNVLNLRSGSRVGSSQVTAVVQHAATHHAQAGPTYQVAFIADLVAPYLVKLTEHAVA